MLEIEFGYPVRKSAFSEPLESSLEPLFSFVKKFVDYVPISILEVHYPICVAVYLHYFPLKTVENVTGVVALALLRPQSDLPQTCQPGPAVCIHYTRKADLVKYKGDHINANRIIVSWAPKKKQRKQEKVLRSLCQP